MKVISLVVSGGKEEYVEVEDTRTEEDAKKQAIRNIYGELDAINLKLGLTAKMI